MSMMVSPQASAVTGRRNLYTASMVPAINAQIPYLYQNRQLENQQRQWEEQQRQWQKEYDQAQSQFEQSYDLNKSIADRNYQLAQEQAAQQKKNAKTAMLVQGLQGVGNLYSAYKMGQGFTGGTPGVPSSAVREIGPAHQGEWESVVGQEAPQQAAGGGVTGTTGVLGSAWDAAKGFGGDVLSSYGDFSTWGAGLGGGAIGAAIGDDWDDSALYGGIAGAGLDLARQAVTGSLFETGVDFASTVGSGLLGGVGGALLGGFF